MSHVHCVPGAPPPPSSSPPRSPFQRLRALASSGSSRGRGGGAWVLRAAGSEASPPRSEDAGERDQPRTGGAQSPGDARSGRGSSAATRYGVETRQGRARKRRRSRGGALEHDPELGREPEGASPPRPLLPSPTRADTVSPDAVDEAKGGLPAGPAADEVSAGEGPAAPGDGGVPARGHEGGGVREGSGGGAQQRVHGAPFVGEEGDYAADSEKSRGHEPVQRRGRASGGGGGRVGTEADEHELSEREVMTGREGDAVGGRGKEAGPAAAAAVAAAGRRGRNEARSLRTPRSLRSSRSAAKAPTPRAVADRDADGENSPRRDSEGEHGRSSGVSVSMPKRRRVGSPGLSAGSSVGARHHQDEPTSGGCGDAPCAGGCSGAEGQTRRARARARVGAGDAGGDGECDIADAEQASEASRGRRSSGTKTKAEEIASKLLKEGQPVFVSRGQVEEHDGGSLREGDKGVGRGGGSSGRGGDQDRPPSAAQDPEDHPDRASSCSSANSAGATSLPASTVRPGAGGVLAGGSDTRPGLMPRVPNTPGGPVPWHETSVYEANDPTEDRHVELADQGLGIRVYCVCDGHGGGRAAQFVCDNLARDVLERVAAMARERQAGEGGGERGGGKGGRGSGGGGSRGGSRAHGAGCGGGEEVEVWTGDEEEVRRTLAEAFALCDERFIAQLNPKKNRGYINAGCCVVLALLIRHKLYLAHVGDCRAVLGTVDPTRFPPARPAISPSAPLGASPEVGAVLTYSVSDGRRGSDRRGPPAAPPQPPPPTAAPASEIRGTGCVSEAAGGNTGEVVAVALSRDHNCDDMDEAAMVRARSGDENAIRVSRNDEWKGSRAIKRVAGSLAVTRAIGDAYLKEAVFSFSPYKASSGRRGRAGTRLVAPCSSRSPEDHAMGSRPLPRWPAGFGAGFYPGERWSRRPCAALSGRCRAIARPHFSRI